MFVCSQFFPPQPRLRRSSPCWPSRMTSSSGGKTSRWRQHQHQHCPGKKYPMVRNNGGKFPALCFLHVCFSVPMWFDMTSKGIKYNPMSKEVSFLCGNCQWYHMTGRNERWADIEAIKQTRECSVVTSCFNVQLDSRFYVNNTKENKSRSAVAEQQW
jgi:hypothetical protein